MDIDTATQTLANSKNIIWQVLEKEHIDYDEKLTEEQWEEFVQSVQNKMAEALSEMVQEEFDNFVS